ncbi:MAG: hypothetical protein IPP74_01405 [Alphaproteobacteria bacterium]|nr:hypothetical protein [Alphaproteobacteria bacterium]
MNICIKRSRDWLNAHPKAKQWAWFIALRCGSLLMVIAAAYSIKWLIRSVG